MKKFSEIKAEIEALRAKWGDVELNQTQRRILANRRAEVCMIHVAGVGPLRIRFSDAEAVENGSLLLGTFGKRVVICTKEELDKYTAQQRRA